MLAALFIQGGINALRAPEAHAQAAKPVLDAVAPAVDKATEAAPVDQRPDDELLIKLDAGVKIVAGTMLAFGKFPRLAATALAATLVPTTLAGHRFWEESDPARKQEQQVHFMKNVGLFGGLLIAAADTHGKPSLGWRGRRAARLAATQAGAVTGAAADVTGRVTGAVHDASGKVSGSARQAGGTFAGLAAGLAGLAPAAGAAVSSRASRTGSDLSSLADEITAEVSRRTAKARRRAEKRGAKLQKTAEKRSTQLQKAAEKRGAQLRKRAAKRLDRTTPLTARVSAVGSEVAHQAGGLAKDARKRAHALTR
ncbi:DoxX family protein [Pseudonocardia sp. DSM 110487]|uniref:DoxX family protein n=1 Tax=Pseudonocardia sp. DSM 110487 TaxID=2865833 RepID=UPI001C6A0A01|nr:DoxX family protein [Pseudonocardia sp. DSM 110487]QYN33340.1 DoxX family protein [Pseudonocardia sp. DSM 110487]